MLGEALLGPVAHVAPEPLKPPVAPEPLETPCEKPEQPSFCEVGWPKRPCCSEIAEIKWNSAVGYWYCASFLYV